MVYILFVVHFQFFFCFIFSGSFNFEIKILCEGMLNRFMFIWESALVHAECVWRDETKLNKSENCDTNLRIISTFICINWNDITFWTNINYFQRYLCITFSFSISLKCLFSIHLWWDFHLFFSIYTQKCQPLLNNKFISVPSEHWKIYLR